MFNIYDYNIDLVARPFDNLKYRDKTVLVVCKDSAGRFLLGASKQYPEGIVRLMGGGVDKEEELLHAAIREVKEETNIDITPEELIELAQVRIAGNFQGQTYNHTVNLYFLNSKKDDLIAGDDVSDIVAYTEEEYNNLISNFKNLKPDHLSSEDGDGYSWGDFGKVYAFVHQTAIDEIDQRNL